VYHKVKRSRENAIIEVSTNTFSPFLLKSSIPLAANKINGGKDIKKYKLNSSELIVNLLHGIKKMVKMDQKDSIEVNKYISAKKLRNNNEFVETLRKWYRGYPIKTLDKEYPEIAKLWDYEKNNPYTPDIIHPGTDESFYFICENGHSTLSRQHYCHVC